MAESHQQPVVVRATEILGTDPRKSDAFSAAELARCAKTLRLEGYSSLQHATDLFRSDTRKAIELGLLILPTQDAGSARSVMSKIIEYCDHEDWEIREYAGEALGELLKHFFNQFAGQLRSLRKTKSDNIRRGVVLGIKYLGKYRGAANPEKCLTILGHYMNDPAPYVQRNLGPFAIGDAMLLYYPEVTLTFLAKHAGTKNPISRWNVAAAFTTAVGAKQGKAGIRILKKLVVDSDARVRRVTTKALNNISNRSTEKEVKKTAGAFLRVLQSPITNVPRIKKPK